MIVIIHKFKNKLMFYGIKNITKQNKQLLDHKENEKMQEC